jgi:protein-disulfide isomerase
MVGPHRPRGRPRPKSSSPAVSAFPALGGHSAAALLALGLALTGGSALAQTNGAPNPPTRGSEQPILEIIEFSDFQCPYCAGATPVLDSLLVRHPSEVRHVYRHYPLPIHTDAERAAVASMEAARQGAFWPYHDLLFAHQDRLTDVDLIGYADSLGLDEDAFARALRERLHADLVAADVALGRSLAVHGTPTFFLNGYRLAGVPPLWVFEEALRAFREGRATARPLEPSISVD